MKYLVVTEIATKLEVALDYTELKDAEVTVFKENASRYLINIGKDYRIDYAYKTQLLADAAVPKIKASIDKLVADSEKAAAISNVRTVVPSTYIVPQGLDERYVHKINI